MWCYRGTTIMPILQDGEYGGPSKVSPHERGNCYRKDQMNA
jgi:hypothetical protein